MVELFVFAPGEQIDEEAFAEVMLRTPGPLTEANHATPVILDRFGESMGEVRFAVRRAAFEVKVPAPMNPLSVACPSCDAEPWDPCVARSGFGDFTPRVSLVTHAERRFAATGKRPGVLP